MRSRRCRPPKNLKDVARHLAGGVAESAFAPDDKVIADLHFFGAPQSVIQDAERARTVADDLEVFDDTWPSVLVFQRMQTQWRTRGMDGEICGLDFTTFARLLRVTKVPRAEHDQVFDDVCLMELETLKVVAEKRR